MKAAESAKAELKEKQEAKKKAVKPKPTLKFKPEPVEPVPQGQLSQELVVLNREFQSLKIEARH